MLSNSQTKSNHPHSCRPQAPLLPQLPVALCHLQPSHVLIVAPVLQSLGFFPGKILSTSRSKIILCYLHCSEVYGVVLCLKSF